MKGSAAVTIEFGWTTGKRDDRHIGPPVLDSADPAAGWFRPGKTIEWPERAPGHPYAAPKDFIDRYANEEIKAAPGRVRTQATAMFPATPHLTADSRRRDPTPMIPPVIVWVVETGIPPKELPIIEAAAAVSAQNPLTGISLVIRIPMVFTTRQPPISVPRAMAT